MKSDKEVNEKFDEENQMEEGRTMKGTSNAKNYTSRCIGVGLTKMFTALSEEDKGALRTTCFAPFLLINPIAAMSTLVMEIFDHHLAMMASKTAMLQELVQEAMRKHIEVATIGVVPAIEPPAVSVPAISSSSSATEIRAVVVKLEISTLPLGDTLLLGQYQFSTPEKTIKCKREEKENPFQQVVSGEGLKVVKDLMVDDDVEVGRKVNLEAISSEYGGGLQEQKNGDEKVDDIEKDGEEKVKSEEEQPQVAEEEDSEQQTVVVYYNGKKDIQHGNETMVVANVAKDDIVFFNQEEVVGEAY
ncbi:hypothetical protein GIB67_006507 [Kingdonia uniflora]|uniref:Uncharacterized protein n=1 Tax=Kingdonia uniflora TaxID=39325 RepID=A0A7J7LES3_9MAGN|nr:hypothetical protein GIB67_006507 [Kingdonia uniflora]